MYSFVFSFYICKNNTSEIFEDNQRFLKSNIEKLSEFFEKEVHMLCDDRKSCKMKTVVDFCQKASNQMIETVQEGKQENKWIFRNI